VFVSFRKIKSLNPRINESNEEVKIGKKGLTEETYKMIYQLLLKKKALKIRVLKNCPETIEDLMKKLTNGDLMAVQNRGRTFIVVMRKFLKK